MHFFYFRAFTNLTMDVIARCAFGTTINTFDDPGNIFVKYVKKLSFDDGESNILFTGACKIIIGKTF